MNIKEALNKGAGFLEHRDTAVLDAEVLLANVLGVSREYLLAHGEEAVDDGLAKLYDQYLKRCGAGEPVAYLIREKEFYGFNFFVDNRVLVPRPETEMLVDEVIDFMNVNCEKGKKFKILEVGTGSGNIAVSIAKYCMDNGLDLLDCVYALDTDEKALEVARINIEQHGVEDKVNLTQSNLLEVLEEKDKYDIVVMNLPYIGTVEHRDIDENVEKFEPEVALFGGEDGLELYKKLFQEVKEKDVDFKFMVGEFGSSQTESLKELLNKFFEQRWSIEKDMEGNDRIFMVKNN